MSEAYWNDVFLKLKSGEYNGVRNSNDMNPLNAAIINGAPKRLIKLLIENSDPSILTTPSPNHKNVTLHYLLGTSPLDLNKRVDYELVKMVIDRAPETFYAKNHKGLTPTQMISEKNKDTIRKLILDTLPYLKDLTAYQRLAYICNTFDPSIVKNFVLSARADFNKRKDISTEYKKQINVLLDDIIKLAVELTSKSSTRSAQQLIQSEEREKERERKRIEIAAKVKLARLEQERKEQAAKLIQKQFRTTQQMKRKGLYTKAPCYIPRKKELELVLDDIPLSVEQVSVESVLPSERELNNVYTPPVHERTPFYFGGDQLKTVLQDINFLLKV